MTTVLPKLEFQQQLTDIAEKIFIPMMRNNMLKQVSIDGKSYPPLEHETIARKSGQILKRTFTKAGKLRETASKTISKSGLQSFLNKTLFETGQLFASFRQRKYGKRSVIIYLTDNRADIGTYLQKDGVGRKRKKFKFFGISKEMNESAMNYMNKAVKEAVNARR